MIGPTGEDVMISNQADRSIISETELNQLNRLTRDQIMQDYQIQSTLDWLKINEFKIIGLQFPDELLPISVSVFKFLRSGLPDQEVELYLMADTSYGSCCVDDVAAQHVNAQAIVHYGSACLSTEGVDQVFERTARLPVFYVLPRLPISDQTIETISKQLIEASSYCHSHSNKKSETKGILLMYDVGYHWKIDQIADSIEKISNITLAVDRLCTRQDKIVNSNPRPSSSIAATTSPCCQTQQEFSKSVCDPSASCCMNRDRSSGNSPCVGSGLVPRVDHVKSDSLKPQLDYSIFQAVLYVGSESRRLTHLSVTNPNLPIFAIDPLNFDKERNSCKLQTERTNKLLMRRYGTIQRARDADVFGILVGTLGVRNYLNLISQTKELIEHKFKKKSYIISVGKLKPEKLINFSEIECWVLIDCPENSLLVLDYRLSEGCQGYDVKEYGIPIITPWELEIALNSCLEEEEEIDENVDNNQVENRKRRVWEGKLVLDFERLLETWNSDSEVLKSAGIPELKPETNGSDEQDAPVFSMVTGKYKYRRNWNGTNGTDLKPTNEQQLTLKDPKSELIEYVRSAASEYDLKFRTYPGLEPRIGMDNPSKMEIGRFGIAQGYDDDHQSINEQLDD